MKKKRIKLKKLLIVCIIYVFAMIITNSNFTRSEIIAENGHRVEPLSELTYYLDVYYDGIDKTGAESSDTMTAEVNSNTINIVDKLPEGLTFLGFVGSPGTSIGAVKRSDGSVCSGYVDGGYNGLKYDTTNRTVSFNVKNMQAGCKITVGIRTRLPSLPAGVTRMDFYNTANGAEGSQAVVSNTVHVWMGQEAATLYSVSYKYTGTIPTGAPKVPDAGAYTQGASVSVAAAPTLQGYTFSGWTTSNATISNGKFTMPSRNVELTGSFTELPKYSVTYSITGDKPSNYVLPTTKQYYANELVNLDILAPGDVIDGYRFNGWTTSDVTISETGNFNMPAKNITITGSFTEIKYKVKYEFEGAENFYTTEAAANAGATPSTLPKNSSTLLPPEATYKPGEIVTLPTISDVPGFEFNGWKYEDNFEMPEQDITIKGTWQAVAGTFEPQIKMDIISTPEYYKPGDKVKYEITVTNPYNFPISDVLIRGQDGILLEDTPNSDRILDNLIRLNSIEAQGEIKINGYYIVKSTDENELTKSVVLENAIGTYSAYQLDATTWMYALYNFNDQIEYKDSATFKVQSKLKICGMVTNSSDGNKLTYHITKNNHVSGLDYETWLVMDANECQTIYISPGDYTVSEIVPHQYTLDSVTGAINKNNGTFTAEFSNNYEITFNNSFTAKRYYKGFDRIINRLRWLIT